MVHDPMKILEEKRLFQKSMLAKMEIVDISDSSIKNIMKRLLKISDSGKKHVILT